MPRVPLGDVAANLGHDLGGSPDAVVAEAQQAGVGVAELVLGHAEERHDVQARAGLVRDGRTLVHRVLHDVAQTADDLRPGVLGGEDQDMAGAVDLAAQPRGARCSGRLAIIAAIQSRSCVLPVEPAPNQTAAPGPPASRRSGRGWSGSRPRNGGWPAICRSRAGSPSASSAQHAPTRVGDPNASDRLVWHSIWTCWPIPVAGRAHDERDGSAFSVQCLYICLWAMGG